MSNYDYDVVVLGAGLALVWFRQAETDVQCDVPTNKRISNSRTIQTQTKEASHV